MSDETKRIMQNWKTQSPEEKQWLKQKLAIIKSADKKKVNFEMKKNTNEIFQKFDCLQCANCCKTTPPIFTIADIKRIAKHFKMPPKIFKRKYTIEDLDKTLVGARVPCVFLEEDNTCSVYEIRPQACRSFPHTDDPKFIYRTDMNYNNTQICPAAYSIVKKL